mmetsp:Transcript_105678/g.275972  ORF Transcript_105678/g.275972 Transcript_105678/m.275972 type:complete len:516 (+) Transcript_105678:135-1682(+)
MARLVQAFVFVASCGALSFERRDPDYIDPEDIRQFSQSSSSITSRINGGSIKADSGAGRQFGRDAAIAEQAAARARDEAARLIREDADKDITERQFEAMSRHAESLTKREEREEMMLENVVDSMEKEADTESKAVEDLERQTEKLQSKEVRWQKGQEVEELRGADGQWVEDPAFKNEELRERSQDADFAREESQAARALVMARKQLDSARASEKMELHRRQALQHELRARLAPQADALRREAATGGTLSEEGVRRALDVSKRELDKITSTFASWSSDSVSGLWIEGRLEESRAKAAIASARMLDEIKHKVETFKAQSKGYDDHQFIARLAQLLNETRAEVTGVENFDDVLMGKLRHWDEGNSETLTYNLAVALQGVTRSAEFKSHLLQMDTARLGHASASEACGLLGQMVKANLQPVYNSIESQREALDGLSKIAPSITETMPDYIQTTMMNRTGTVLNMAYVEHLALKEAATVIAQDAVPLVLERLRCVASGAERVAAPALPALLGAAAAWLAQ